MRPVNKGPWPKDSKNKPIPFSKYKYARRYLIDRLGQYCSYCESKLPSSLHIEHVIPKSRDATKEREWGNFLLACTNCNSTKGDKKVIIHQYVWPDLDNTFLSFQYDESGLVSPAPAHPDEETRARRLINLTALDRPIPKKGTGDYEGASDRRWENRLSAWTNATKALKNYLSLPPENKRIQELYIEQITITVLGEGFWSIYMTVFKDVPEVRKRLIEQFPGTNQECFDESGMAVEWSCESNS